MAQFTLTLTRAQLRAALIFAADKDIRYYINGVMLQVGECGDCRLVATDGHRLAVLDVGDHPGATPGEYIMPRDALKSVKRAARRGSQTVDLQIDGGRVMITDGGDIIAGGLLIDGQFPDWQRVCPEPSRMSGEIGTFNAFYLGDIGRALVELGEKFPALEILHNGTSAGLVLNPEHGLMVAIMPMRGAGFVPTDSARAHFMPRRPVFAAVVETARGGQAYPCDPAQDVSDKRAPAVVAHCSADIAAWIDPAGTMRAAGLLAVAHVGDALPSEAKASGEAQTAHPSGERKKPEVLTVEAKMRDGDRVQLLASIPAWSRKRGENKAHPLTYGSMGVAEARAAKLRAAGVAATVYGRGPYSIIIDPSGESVAAADACPTLIAGRWIPGGAENAERIAFDAAIGAEVWLIPSRRRAGELAVIAYSGKRGKHDAHYTMRDRAQALQWAGEYLGKLQGHAQRKADQRAEQAAKRAAGHKLQAGDVLRCSWGYDQTNIDYYEVTRLIGKRMVEIRKIGAESVESGHMTGECVPRPGHYIGEPMRKAVSDYDGQSVRIASYASAHKIEPREVAGVKCYPVDHWTAYA